MNKRCVIYSRVSSEKQVDGYSLDAQEDICKNRAIQLGYEIVEVFREEGESGKLDNRTKFTEMLSFCMNRKNDISMVFVYTFSRFFRNTESHLVVKRQLSKYGVALTSISEPTDDSPVGRFVETLFAANAQLENEMRAMNVANALKRRFSEGHITAKPPLGYIMVKRDGKSVAEPDPETFAILQQYWKKMENGLLSCQQVAQEWNKYEIKSKHDRRFKRWSKQSVSKIFANKFYIGILVSEKYGEVRGKHLPMVSENTYLNVRAYLTGKRTNFMSRITKNRVDFPLRGTLRCHLCGRKLTASWSKGRNGRVPYYSCYSRKEHKSTSYNSQYIHKEWLQLLDAASMTDKMAVYIGKIIKEKYHSRIGVLQKVNKDLVKEIDVIKETRKRLIQKHLDGIYSDDDFRDMRDDLDMQLTVKQAMIKDSKLDKIDIDTTLNFIIFYMTHLKESWERASLEGKQRIQGSMFPDGLVVGKLGLRTASLAHCYKLNKAFNKQASLSVSRMFATSNQMDNLISTYISTYHDLNQFVYT